MVLAQIVNNMNNEIILIISNSLTAIAAWFFGRKKQQADTDNQVLKNLEISVNLYRQIIDDLKKEIEQKPEDFTFWFKKIITEYSESLSPEYESL